MRLVNVAPYPYLALREARKLARFWNGSVRKERAGRYSVWATFHGDALAQTAPEDAPRNSAKLSSLGA